MCIEGSMSIAKACRRKSPLPPKSSALSCPKKNQLFPKKNRLLEISSYDGKLPLPPLGKKTMRKKNNLAQKAFNKEIFPMKIHINILN